MIVRALSFVAISLLPGASEGPAMPQAFVGGTPNSVKFLYEDARIYVPVRVGSGAVRWFILDTGATDTIIDGAVARAAHLPIRGRQTVAGAGAGTSQQRETKGLTLLIGNVPMHVARPAVLDLARLLGPTSGRSPAGIIGSQFFLEHFVDVDFDRRRITVYNPGEDRSAHYARAAKLTFADWTPLAHVVLTLPDGRLVRANALVDLGAKSTFLVPEPFIDREKLRDSFGKMVVTGFGAGVGGDTFYAFARARRLGFAGAPGAGVANPVIGLSVQGTLRSTWNEGLLGAEFLSGFRLGFDYRHQRLLMSLAHRQPQPFDRSGLFLVAAGPGLRGIVVRQILAGGPGEAAGMMKGDRLLAVNGAPVSDLGLAAVRARLKQPGNRSVAIIYLRGAVRRMVRLELGDLL